MRGIFLVASTVPWVGQRPVVVCVSVAMVWFSLGLWGTLVGEVSGRGATS